MNSLIRKPKVSVCVVTYNQEKYIFQCLQSIVDQVTNFDFEVIVGDDFSTDETKNIVLEFSKKYPRLVKPILHKTNKGPNGNFMSVHLQATADYVAHVDGDDYYLPGKLQAQADVLDKYPDCNIVWHRMNLLLGNGSIVSGPLADLEKLNEKTFTRADIIQYISIGLNSSKMYRGSIKTLVHPAFEMADYYVNVEQIGSGTARFTGQQPYGIYRVGVGISSSSINSRISLSESFKFFSSKYPEFRLQANTAALTYLISDVKNVRKSSFIFLSTWIKTFHWRSMLNLISSLDFLKQLKLKI